MRCTEAGHATEVAKIVHQVLGESIDVVRRRALAGDVFLELPIWTNEHDDVAAKLRILVAKLRAADIEVDYFVLLEDQDLARPADLEDARANSEELLALLKGHEVALDVVRRHDDS